MQKTSLAIPAAFGALALIALSFGGSANDAQAQARYQNNYDGIAWCWKNSKGYYWCYGPTQRTSAGEVRLNKALDYAGCYDPRLENFGISGNGVCRGAKFHCNGTKMWNYHNQPKRISKWVRDKGC